MLCRLRAQFPPPLPDNSWSFALSVRGRSLRSRQVTCAVSRGVALQHLHFYCTVSIRGAARIGVVSQAVLGGQFVIDTIEDHGELRGGGGTKQCAAGFFLCGV